MFTIDNVKVQELTDAQAPAYSVTASHLMINEAPQFNLPNATVYGADFSAPASMIDAENYILGLRKRVVASGLALKSAEDIDREISEMRRHLF